MVISPEGHSPFRCRGKGSVRRIARSAASSHRALPLDLVNLTDRIPQSGFSCTLNSALGLPISGGTRKLVRARIALATAFLKLADPAAARTELDRALAIDPKSDEARRMLAEIK